MNNWGQQQQQQKRTRLCKSLYTNRLKNKTKQEKTKENDYYQKEKKKKGTCFVLCLTGLPILFKIHLTTERIH